MTPKTPDNEDRADRFVSGPGEMKVTLPPKQAAELARRQRARGADAEKIAGLELAELRAAAGLSQVQLAERLGIPQTSVSRLEHQDDLKVSTLVAYLEALDGHVELVTRGDRHRLEGASKGV